MKTLSRHLSRLLSLLVFVSLQAQTAPVLTMAADSSEQAVGSQFNISLDISGISDLYAFNLTLGYDASKVRFMAVTEGDFLSNVNTTYFIPGVDDRTGSVAFSAVALIGPISGAGGAGNLLNFVFAGSAPGAAHFSLSDILFIDSAFGDIGVGGASLEVLVLDDPAGVPEPAPLALLAIGTLALAARKNIVRRRPTPRDQLE